MKEIEQKEGITKNEYRLINIFILSIYRNNTQETFYLLEKFIKLNYIKPKMVYRKSLSFIHYLKEKTICIRRSLQFSYYVETNYEKLSANNWELHKQLIKEGVNPNEISKIIRNDEIDKLQEISTQENFDFNQIIEPSLYERCSFINQNNVTLIDYAAFFSSVKCFKYLLMNGAKLENTGKYAVAGGNLEIIHLCEQNHSSLNDTIDIAIRYHKNDVFYYLYENKFYDTKDLSSIQKKCIIYYNYELILFLFKKGMNFPLSTLNEIAKIGNIYILQPYIDENQISNEILIYSSLSGNIELVKYIIEKNIIDINFETI